MSHGKHVKVVGYGNPIALGSVEGVKKMLTDLVAKVGMRPLGEPVMHDVELDLSKMNVEPFEDEGGVTGVVVLSTSHCAIHTWPARSFFVLDLYSCRSFDLDAVEDLVTLQLGVTKCRFSDLSIALEPPAP